MKKKHRVGIMAKLISMSTLPVIFLGVILTVYGQYALRTNLKAEIYDGLKSAAISVKGAYDAAGEGDFVKLQSGNIIKGTFIVNNNYNLGDSLSESAGTETAFFYGEEAVVTSFMDEEKNRILDMKADQEVNDQVLGQGKEYFSENVGCINYILPVSSSRSSFMTPSSHFLMKQYFYQVMEWITISADAMSTSSVIILHSNHIVLCF